jgi:predicted dienelactone hydrolase
MTAGLAAGLAAGVAAPVAAQPAPRGPVKLSLPAPTGPSPIGRVELHLVDRNRDDPLSPGRPRELMVSVWYPATAPTGRTRAPYMAPAPARLLAERLLKPLSLDAGMVDFAGTPTNAVEGARAAKGRHPIVLYSPGGGMPRTAGTALAEDLASRGYVVVAIDHTFEAPAVAFPGGRVELAAAVPVADAARRYIEARIADTLFVLGRLHAWRDGGGPVASGQSLPAGLARALDPARTGMFGHSAGGFTALETMGRDARLHAAVDLDGSLGFDMANQIYAPVVEQGLDRPFLLMGAGLAGPQRRPHNHQGAPEWRRLWERSSGWKRDVFLARGQHMGFSDLVALLPQIAGQMGVGTAQLTRVIGEAPPEQMLGGQRAYLAAFFDLHLQQKPQPLFDGPSPAHPDFELIA